jgi:hypothetical protein
MTATALAPSHQNFIAQLGRAAADLTRARDTAVQAIDASTQQGLHVAFNFAHKATARLHDAVAKAPTFDQPGDPLAITRRAINQADAGLVELDRAFDGKPVSLQSVADAWNSAVHSIGSAQSLVKYPPSADVYDGS